MNPIPPDAASLWKASAPPLELSETLSPGSSYDVVIVGGGFTGLSSALELAERGIKAAVLEAGAIGVGASGLNNGQVIPGLKHDPDELLAKFGPDMGERLVALSQGAADTVYNYIERFGIDCALRRHGWIQAAHSERALVTVMARAEALARRGAPVQFLTREAVTNRTGTRRYHGGWVDTRAATINPLAYARGLARAAIGLGARIFEHTPVVGLERNGPLWHVRTKRGTVMAERVVLATNAYSDALWPRLNRTVLPVTSIQIATRPLGKAGAHIVPGGECVSETRKLAFAFRRDPEGRLIIASRGPILTERAGRLFGRVRAAFERMFPGVNLEPEYRWIGRIALTMDGLPHLHEPMPGVLIALGYNGRGVAMASTMGGVIAKRIAGANREDFPVTPLEPIFWHSFRRPIMAAGVSYYWMKDSLGISS